MVNIGISAYHLATQCDSSTTMPRILLLKFGHKRFKNYWTLASNVEIAFLFQWLSVFSFQLQDERPKRPHSLIWSAINDFRGEITVTTVSSINTGEHTKQQRFKSKRRKIVNGKDCVTFHRTTAYHCCHSVFRWKLRWVFIPSWLILDQRFIESTTPDRW